MELVPLVEVPLEGRGLPLPQGASSMPASTADLEALAFDLDSASTWTQACFN